MLPTTPEYTDALNELAALGERLQKLPTTWNALRAANEKKLVDQIKKLSYMEQTGPKLKHWMVYYADGSDITIDNLGRPPLQQAS